MEGKLELERILVTEWNEMFDTLRKHSMVTSYFKYGEMKKNYGVDKGSKLFPKGMKAIESIKKNIEKYLETGNTECLVDIANFAMIEFTYPSLENAKFEPTESKDSVTQGVSIKEIENMY